LAEIQVGDRWMDAAGVTYVVVSVGGMGVVGYRRDRAPAPTAELSAERKAELKAESVSFTDAVRFVRTFVRQAPLRAPRTAAMARAG
jgi:hypothetical protein